MELCVLAFEVVHAWTRIIGLVGGSILLPLLIGTRGITPCVTFSTHPRMREMARLCVNIDHVATIREARRIDEPDPVLAALAAQRGGASGITIHLREDRRHIQDHDLQRLIGVVERLNLEMAATEEMLGIALSTAPQMAMLVPEGRMEVTTEGGTGRGGPP